MRSSLLFFALLISAPFAISASDDGGITVDDVSIGTPFSDTATRVLVLGGGELGKNPVMEFKKLGCEVAVMEKYDNAPGMQVADHKFIGNMMYPEAIEEAIRTFNPQLIISEIEAIDTDSLLAAEKQGFKVIPSAKAVHTTMNRKRIRQFAAEKLNLPTSKYRFAKNSSDCALAVLGVGYPCVVKPNISSSGKGQSLVREEKDIQAAWDKAQEEGRVKGQEVIVEEFIDFAYEVTQPITREKDGTLQVYEPVGHRQESGDYQESWQPCQMTQKTRDKAENIAKKIVEGLGGHGLYNVELFIGKNGEVWFSEVAPRPHDTCMVTEVSQNLSQAELLVRAALGLKIGEVKHSSRASASAAINIKGHSKQVLYNKLNKAYEIPGVTVRLFGKPEVQGERRMGVVFAQADTVEEARENAMQARDIIQESVEL